MGFIKDIPDYKNYSDDDYFMKKVPDSQEMWEALEAYASRADSIKAMVNRLNDIALLRQTSNWGYDFLINDLADTIRVIKRKSTNEKDLPLFFDAITAIVDEVKINIDEMNAFLEKHNVGYEIFSGLMGAYHWGAREGLGKLSEDIDETITTIKESDFDQALEHIQQAKKQLENAKDERSRKNAVRDCASAMESVIKILGEVNDIGKATKALRESKKWGLDAIIKDGNTIFDRLHEFYPDFRHGSTETSSMSVQEALYWVGRMTVFINYIVAQKKQLDVHSF
jgi:hypothetical protein